MTQSVHKRLVSILVSAIPFFVMAQSGGITSTTVCLFQNRAVQATDAQPDQIKPFAVNEFVDQTYAPMSAASRDIVNVVTLEIHEETALIIPDLTALTVDIEIQHGASATNYQTMTKSLTVNYKKGEGTKYDAKNYLSFKGDEYVKVILKAVPPPAGNGFDPNNILTLKLEMIANRWYMLDPAAGIPVFSASSSVPQPRADEWVVAWDQFPPGYGKNGFQLEWAWVETEMLSAYGTPGTVAFYNEIFNNNSTRVDLPNNALDYNIPVYYDGAGTLYYRFRGVNVSDAGRKDGPWSAVGEKAYTEGHDDRLNWQVRTSFAEEGKRKSVMEYFDGGLRSRQTVTKDNETGNTIAAETFYDGEGRPAVQILPAPLLGASGIASVIQYNEGINLFNGQASSQSPTDFFDLVDKTSNPGNQTPVLKTSSGTAKYYSPSNGLNTEPSDAYIPDAAGWPYSVTRYTPDATGRVMIQSGVGKDHKMGSRHETKYFYGTPSQEELDGLFGTEVGNYTHYFKNMVLDANSQASVSYVDMHGRTIATALAGDAPTNLAGINEAAFYPGQQHEQQVTRNLLDANTNLPKNSKLLESVTSLLVPVAESYTFNYSLSPQSLGLKDCAAADICFGCRYDLEIAVIDESGDEGGVNKVWKFNNLGAPGVVSTTCPSVVGNFQLEDGPPGATISATGISIVCPLTIGSYSIRKTLTINEASFQAAKEEYLKTALCNKTLKDLTDSVAATIPCDVEEPEKPTCQTCMASIQGFQDQYLASLGYNPTNPAPEAVVREADAAYKNAEHNCQLMCAQPSATIATKRSLMLLDMVPFTGQYAIKNPDPSDPMAPIYNIFSSTGSGSRPFYKFPVQGNPDGSHTPSVYKNQLGQTDKYLYPDDAPEILTTMVPDDFSDNFNNSWAESLLFYHPEYKRLLYAENEMAASYSWIYDFNNTLTYDEAANQGYIYPVSSDPFYALETGAARSDMVKWVGTDYMNQGQNGGQAISMWQMAYSIVNCKGVIDADARKTCINLAPMPPYNNLPERDEVWKQFRALYMAERDQHVNAYIAAQVPMIYGHDQALIDNKYKLHFTKSNAQLASQYEEEGWTWYPDERGGAPAGVNMQDSLEKYNQAGCEGYIAMWRKSLLQCEALASPTLTETVREQILTDITDGMLAVCKKGINAANQIGSSTVPPSTPADGEPRSFEEVIEQVFSQKGITKDYYCNPYVIEAPRPYGLNRPVSKEFITILDTCTCGQFDKIKAEAALTVGTITTLGQLNGYLEMKYGEGITAELYNIMGEKCSSLRDTVCTTVYEEVAVTCPGQAELYKEPFSNDLSRVEPFDPVTGSQPTYYWVTGSSNVSEYITSPRWSNSVEAWSGISGEPVSSARINYEYNGLSMWLPNSETLPVSISFYADFDIQSGQKMFINSFSFDAHSGVYGNWSVAVNGTSVATGGELLLYSTNVGGNTNILNNITGHVRIEIKYYNKRTNISSSISALNNFHLYGDVLPVTQLLQEANCPVTFVHASNNAGVVPVSYVNPTAGTCSKSCPVFYCHDTAYLYPLPTPQPLPEFLKCGFEGRKLCYTCADMQQLVTDFKGKFAGTPYTKNPVFTPNLRLSDDQVKLNVLFARYVNFKTGMNYSWAHYAAEMNKDNCPVGGGGGTPINDPVVCRDNTPLNDTTGLFVKETSCYKAYSKAISIATQIYEARIRDRAAAFEAAYRARCLGVAGETFTVSYKPSEYHYTLYYYDQAGNLVQTVPPAGARPNYDPAFLAATRSHRQAGYPDNDVTRPVKRPSHKLLTRYLYNSLNQVAIQTTPDGGESHFWYDHLGRLAVSQNAKQKKGTANFGDAGGQYSYTLYDALGRITEVGQKEGAIAISQAEAQAAGNPTGGEKPLDTWLASGTNKQITQTVYDLAYAAWSAAPPASFVPANLRNRVAYTVVREDAGQNYRAGTFYSYDIHGNVGLLLQDYASGVMQANGGNRWKLLSYQYDLISGKVNEVAYQPGMADGFYHRYSYDAENRLTAVETSRDHILWLRDARYRYYKHGPLARTELGDLLVQGVDYAYTLQGWLKSINPSVTERTGGNCPPDGRAFDLLLTNRAGQRPEGSIPPLLYKAQGSITFGYNTLSAFESLTDDNFETVLGVAGSGDCNADPTAVDLYDLDGTTRQHIARDAYKLNLHYYDGDYSPVAAPGYTAGSGLTVAQGRKDLYNGNISAMAVNIRKLATIANSPGAAYAGALLYNYQYDQLNRLRNVDAFATHGSFVPKTGIALDNDEYKETYTYDPNGNILSLNRAGTSATNNNHPTSVVGMDKLTYQYAKDAGGNLTSNRLRYVHDEVQATNYTTEDIDSQTPLTKQAVLAERSAALPGDNYQYDEIGNLVKDVEGKIKEVKWTVYGKIESIEKDDHTIIAYGYDASGNRISKLVRLQGAASGTTTWYVRDAQGNVMATYEEGNSTYNNGAITQTEVHLYGSSRLGVLNTTVNCSSNVLALPATRTELLTRGQKFFELTNHLGNVLATVTDRPIQMPDGAGTSLDYYLPDVATASDYYAFGMQMPGRGYSSGAYRYGFNGQEKSDEIAGAGNSYTAEFWQYDARLGRRWNVDPVVKVHESPYATFANNPIFMSDPKGQNGNPSTGGGQATMQASFNFVNNGLSPTEYAQAKLAFMTNVQSFFNGSQNLGGLPINGNFTTSDFGGNVQQAQAQPFQNGVNYVVLGNNVQSSAPVKGGNLAYVNTGDLVSGNNTATHEVLHLFGLSDRNVFANSTTMTNNGPLVRVRGTSSPGMNNPYIGAQDLPASINPNEDPQYLGQETSNVMYNALQSSVTQSQWSIMFGLDARGRQQIEADRGGNNVYLGNLGFNNVPTRQNLGGTVIGINNAGQIGYWTLDNQQQVQWIALPIIRGYVNSISGQASGDLGQRVMANPANAQTIQGIRGNIRP